MKKGKSNYKGADKMKRTIILFVFCMTGLLLMSGVSWSEEAASYDAAENWMVRVYTSTADSNYSVMFEVVDTGNKIVTDKITGMSTNPMQITATASRPDVSLALDENSATAYVTYTAGDGEVSLQPMPDVKRDTGVIEVTSNPELFGSLKAGSTKDKTIKITNTGVSPLNFTMIGTTEAPFTILPETTCAAVIPLAAGKNCKIVVRFAPTAAKPYAGNFVVRSDNGSVNIRLIGTGR
jgi:hypothetical protein